MSESNPPLTKLIKPLAEFPPQKKSKQKKAIHPTPEMLTLKKNDLVIIEFISCNLIKTGLFFKQQIKNHKLLVTLKLEPFATSLMTYTYENMVIKKISRKWLEKKVSQQILKISVICDQETSIKVTDKNLLAIIDELDQISQKMKKIINHLLVLKQISNEVINQDQQEKQNISIEIKNICTLELVYMFNMFSQIIEETKSSCKSIMEGYLKRSAQMNDSTTIH